MRLRRDLGEGPVDYVAITLLIATVAAVLVSTGIPGKVIRFVDAGVCRVGQIENCDPETGAQQPRTPGTQQPTPDQTQPAPGGTQPAGPVDPDSPEGLQQQINDAEREAREAEQEAKNLEGKVDIGDLAKEFGLEASGLADAGRCFGDGDLASCGWTALTVVPVVGWLARGGKAAKAAAKVKKLKEAYDRYKRLANAARRRAEQAREKARQLREKLAKVKACKPNSFLGDTPVLMAGGMHRAIRDVDIGDMVWAADPETGRSGPRAVTDAIAGAGMKRLVRLSVDGDGAGGARPSVITSTDEHPYWVADESTWKDADALVRGDRLIHDTGRSLTVVATREYVRYEQVYNLTVADLHTYFVGDRLAVLVHNVSTPLRCQPPEEIDKKIDERLNSTETARQLEGQVGDALRRNGCRPTQFQLDFPKVGGHDAGEIDAGVPGALIEVYQGQKNLYDKGEQMPSLRNHPQVNPGGTRQVIVFAPNVSVQDRKRFEQDYEEYGVRVFGSMDHLINHLRRTGACRG